MSILRGLPNGLWGDGAKALWSSGGGGQSVTSIPIQTLPFNVDAGFMAEVQGSLFCDFTLDEELVVYPLFEAYVSASDSIKAYIDSGALHVDFITGTVTVVALSHTIPYLEGYQHKMMVTYQADDVVLYVDGNIVGTDTDCAMAPGFDSLYVGSDHTEAVTFNGTIHAMKYIDGPLFTVPAKRLTASKYLQDETGEFITDASDVPIILN